MSGAGSWPLRVRQHHVEWLLDRLTERDRRIVLALARVRLLAGPQLERLAFSDLSGRSRSVVRWRVLKRLTDWRVLLPLGRRVGGNALGSTVTAYALDTAGLALARLLAGDDSQRLPRRPGVPGERFVRHVLGVSELYVSLVEAERRGHLELVDFRAEPDAWLPDGLGGWLKPDAYLVVAAGQVEDCWAVEVDMATEHLPTLKRKCETYAGFHRRGQLGPHGVMPRVLLIVPDEHRREVVAEMLAGLSAESLFYVATEREAVSSIVELLHK